MGRREDVLSVVSRHPGLTDREIAERLEGPNTPQQPYNTTCRALEAEGYLRRERARPSDNFIGNYPASQRPVGHSPVRSDRVSGEDPGARELTEDKIKEVLERWLISNGWSVNVAWGRERGIDIEACRDDGRWVIEVKGAGSRHAMRVNYFLAILGETLQRMDDEQATYSIALPDMPQYRGLWNRLPLLAKTRLGVSVLFVGRAGDIDHVR